MSKLVNAVFFTMFQNKRTTQKERAAVVILTIIFVVSFGFAVGLIS
jgi:hypothetical protein